MAENRCKQITATLGLFLALTWLFVSLRVYVKILLSKSWGPDDSLLIISLIFFSAYSACLLSAISWGAGRHTDNVSLEAIPKALYFCWLCELFYTITTVFIRVSIAVFLLRLAAKRVYKYLIYGVMAMVIGFSTFYFFLLIFQCSPVSYFWGQVTGQNGSCIKPETVPNASIAHSAVSFTADCILGLLPIVLIYNLQMNFRTKASVAGLLSLGLLAGVATMIRLPYIKVIAFNDDILFAITDLVIWSTVGPGLGIVAAAAVTFRPMFRSFYALSTRQKSTTHLTSRSRNSYVGDLQGSNQISSFHAHRRSAPFSTDDEELQIYSTGAGPLDCGVMTSFRDVIGDSIEDIGVVVDGGGDGMHGGIMVQKTAEISRDQVDRGRVSIGSSASVMARGRPGTA